jgi:hypothetical protein
MNENTPTEPNPDDLAAFQDAATQNWNSQRTVWRAANREADQSWRPRMDERILDIPSDIGKGMMGAGNSVIRLANDAGHSLTGSYFKNPEDIEDTDASLATHSFIGGLLKGVTQYLTAGRAMPVGKGLVGKIAVGGLTDFTAFSGADGHLADLIGQSPTMRKYAVGWLMSDPEDSWVTKRIKNAVEGTAMNLLSHGAAKAGGKAFGAAMDSIRGKVDPDMESILRSVSPEALKEITDSPEAARVASQVKAALPTATDDQVKSVLFAYRQMGSRYGRSLDEVLKGVSVKGTTLEEMAAQAAEPEFQGYKPSPEILKMGEDADAAAQAAKDFPPGQLQSADSAMENVSPPQEPMATETASPVGQLQQPDSATLEAGAEKTVPTPSPAEAVLAAKPNPDARGAVSFYGDHQSVIYLFKNADFSTLAHESFHVWEKWWITGEDAAALKSAFGGDREAAAAAFERYLRNGVSPSGSKMGNLMAKFGGWMRSIYTNITGTPLQDEVNPEVRKVFDNIMSGEPHASGLPTPALSEPQVQFQSGLTKTPKLSDALPDEHMAEVRAAVKSIADTGAPPEELLKRAADASIVFNAARTGLEDNALANLEAGFGIVADHLKDSRGGIETLNRVANRAHSYTAVIAEDPERIGRFLKQFEGDADTLAAIKARMGMAREMYVGHSNATAELSAKILNAADSDKPALTKELGWRLEQMWQLQRMDKGVSIEMARGLGARRVIPQGDIDVAKAADYFRSRILTNPNSAEAKQILRDLAAAGTDEVNSASLASKLLKQFSNPVLNAVIEYRTNSLLSGVATSLAKSLSDAVQVAVRPGERFIGGQIQRGVAALFPNSPGIQAWAAGGDQASKVAVQEFVQTAHLAQSIWDVTARVDGVYSPFEAGVRSFKNELHGFEGVPTGKAISAANFSVDPTSGMGRALDTIGPIVRIPGRVMGSVTDVFSQLKYQSMVAGKAAVEAGEQGLKGADEIKSFINGRLREAFNDAGAPTDAEAFAEAGRTTATAPLTGFSKKIGDAINAHPWTKLIVPFYKVPLNLMDTGIQYIPGLQFISSNFRDQLLRGTPAVKAAATGRLAVGAAFWTAAVSLAASGTITGEGPTDPKLRETLLTSGWRPHSIVFQNEDGTKTYVDYHKIEPYANVLSIAGDFAEMGHMMGEKDVSDTATFMVGSIAKNLVSKTYLTGLADFIDMLRKPDATMPKFLGNMAGSFAPRLLGNIDPDGDLRQVRGFLDGVKARVPGYSSTLPPVRNALGEPIMKSDPQWSPIRFASGPNDPVSQEFSQFSKGLPSAPRRLMGMDLTQFSNDKGQDAHDRLAELVGETKINGRSLRDSLGKLFQSQFYQSSPKVDDPNDITNPRVKAVQQLFYGYHEAAKAQLLREYPDIGKFYAAQQKAKAVAGNSNVQRLLAY